MRGCVDLVEMPTTDCCYSGVQRKTNSRLKRLRAKSIHRRGVLVGRCCKCKCHYSSMQYKQYAGNFSSAKNLHTQSNIHRTPTLSQLRTSETYTHGHTAIPHAAIAVVTQPGSHAELHQRCAAVTTVVVLRVTIPVPPRPQARLNIPTLHGIM